MKRFLFTLFVSTILFNTSFAQESSSEIIISDESLKSLIDLIRERRAILFEYNKSKEQPDVSMNETTQKKTSTQKRNQNQFIVLLGKIDSLNQRIESLENTLAIKSKKTNVKTDAKKTTTIKTQEQEPTKVYNQTTIKEKYPKQVVTNPELVKIQEELLELRKQQVKEIQSLKKQLAELKENQTNNLPVAAIVTDTKKESKTEQQIKSPKETKVETPAAVTNIVQVKEKTDFINEADYYDELKYKELVSMYGSFEQNIYFENNSFEITTPTELDKVIEILKAENKLDVYLTGFASKSGSKEYNKKLSARRTAEVKNYFISKGIHPTRVSSYFFGIDENAANENEARRVTVKLIVRK